MLMPAEHLVLTMCLIGALSVLAEETALPTAEKGPLRLSAIVSSGTRYYAGLVDAETGQAYLVPEGGRVLHWRVKSIDEASMTAILGDSDGDEMMLAVTGDEHLAAEVLASQQAPRVKTMEEFLAEHRDLAATTTDQAPLEFPATTNAAVTFEDFLAAHPQWAGSSNYVAPELLESNSVPTAAFSGGDVESEPVSREEGLRRMAAQTGMPLVEDKETTYEEFLQRNAPVQEKLPGSP